MKQNNKNRDKHHILQATTEKQGIPSKETI
jgi:hypothetical protein